MIPPAADSTSADAIVSIVQSCLYPELRVDCGTEAPDSTLNATFRTQLGERLRSLRLSVADADDALSLSARVHLTLLYCEQTAKHADFRTEEAELVQFLDSLRQRIDRWLQPAAEQRKDLHAAVLLWYKERVTMSRWRRQAGATLGLARFAVVSVFDAICKQLSTSRLVLFPPQIGYAQQTLSIDEALFLLAAGSLTMEHFDRAYKELALDMFTVVLRQLPTRDLQATNMADPIFQLAMQQVPHLKGLHMLRLLWPCLCRCLQQRPAAASKWNGRDEAGAALLTRLAFENDATARRYLIQCIPWVFAPTINATDFDDDPDGAASIMRIDVCELRDRCTAAGICLAACRWTKKLAKILPYHVSCCFGAATNVANHLRCVHIAYLSTLYAMPVSLCAPALRELLDELPTHLLQLVWHHRSDDGCKAADLRQEVRELLNSLLQQIQRPSAAANDATDVALGAEWRAFFAGRAETITTILAKIQDD